MNAKQNLYSICIMVLDRLEISILLFVLVGIILVREYMPKITSYLDGKHEDPAFLAVLHQHTKIVKDSSEADIVVPVESSTVASPQTGQVLIHVSNDKVIMDRNSLWKLFCRKGGRSFASEYIPEIFIICQDSASDDYEEFLKRKTEWPSLMFRPFILKNEAKNDTEGLYMTQSDLEDGAKGIEEQQLADQNFCDTVGFCVQFTVHSNSKSHFKSVHSHVARIQARAVHCIYERRWKDIGGTVSMTGWYIGREAVGTQMIRQSTTLSQVDH